MEIKINEIAFYDVCEKLAELHKTIDDLHAAAETIAMKALIMKQGAEQAAILAKQIKG